MALTWNLEELRKRFRQYTGRKTTNQISDDAIDDLINDYLVNNFPSDAAVDEFDTFYTQELTATDDGVYDIPQNVDRFDDPVTINGNEIWFQRDRELFFTQNGLDNRHRFFGFQFTTQNNLHTTKFEDEQFITEPELVIGSSDTTKVKNIDFSYSINNYAYSKDSTESALTGADIPQGKYGAWSFKIDTDGVITVESATSNAVGYDTPRLALEALDRSDSESAYMGYVTVIKTDGAFTPATTDLNAANVTATFTDGRFESRTTPISALLYGQKLYVYPKPNDIYEFKALQISKRPTALTASDEIADPKHGQAIAIGAANLYLLSNDGTDIVQDLAPMTKYLFDSIGSDKIKRLLGQVVQRRY